MDTIRFLLLTLVVSLLTGCSGDDSQSRAEKISGDARLFNTQREALEQAKAAAGAIEQQQAGQQERLRAIESSRD
ncbi:MAG: hypothetical protein KDI63_17440 [Gammaproteobacteria bacterium]|nr:hypothetical protein [Gammaproteobacteria bacterium]